MQKLSINQTLQQRLSPQQIQFIKLLQIPTAELNQRIEEELEINPALEEGMDLDEKAKDDDEFSDEYDIRDDDRNYDDAVDIQEYLDKDDFNGYKMQGDGWAGDDEKQSQPVVSTDSLTESLTEQLPYLKLDEKGEIIAKQLIGSIDDDGYIRRPLRAIVNDLAFTQNVYTSEGEIEKVLKQVQKLEPAGIAARDLQECLLIQLRRKKNESDFSLVAIEIIDKFYEEFTKKHFNKIQKKLTIDDATMHEVIKVIIRLNPKPGGIANEGGTIVYLLPDFIVTTQNGKIEVLLNSKNAPELRISRSFSEMLSSYDKSLKNSRDTRDTKEAVTFIKQKLDSAKWFIDAIKQRQQTLLKTMEAIVRYQADFFWEADENKLKPMILKDIAEIIGMEISTVSRVANSKSVQTDFGIYPLKYFFSEGISTDSGEDASSREVKNILKEIIGNEPKHAPLSDDKLEKILNKKGYNIARRTVAKYREQLNIPVARLRKEV